MANIVIYIYYGKSNATDEANQIAVWDLNTIVKYFLNELVIDSVSEFRDSTVNENHGQGGAKIVEYIQREGGE